MVCPACQAENREGAKFCNECATALGLRCPSCGADHRPGQRFCDSCGLALSPPGGASGRPSDTVEPAAATELRLVSVLFVDIVNYTALSESRDAEDMRELQARYHDKAARSIMGPPRRHAGEVDVGDAVMAVWGAPVAREDDAERAVRAGLELVEAVGALGQLVEFLRRAHVARHRRLAMRHLDAVEALERSSWSETGSTPRLHRNRRRSPARCSWTLSRARRPRWRLCRDEDAGGHAVKWPARAAASWRATRVVAGVRGAPARPGRGAADRPGGRPAPAEALFHGAVQPGAPRALWRSSGEAGVGKSRLRWEFDKYVDGLARDRTVAQGALSTDGEGIAYWALPGDGAPAAHDPPGGGPEPTRRLQSGSRTVGARPPRTARSAASPRRAARVGRAGDAPRAELFAGWRMFLERLAAEAPLVPGVRGSAAGRRGPARVHRAPAGLGGPADSDPYPRAHPPRAGRQARGMATRLQRGVTLVTLEPLSGWRDGSAAGRARGRAATTRARPGDRAPAEGVPLSRWRPCGCWLTVRGRHSEEGRPAGRDR